MATPTEELAKKCGATFPTINGFEFEEQQLQAFRSAVEAESDAERMKQPPVYAFRRKGQDDFCTCTKERFDELSEKPNLFEMRLLYAQPFPSTEQLQQRVKELADALRDIAKQDPVEMALDPQWAARVARITLTACGDVAS